jgi:hypothetical protein
MAIVNDTTCDDNTGLRANRKIWGLPKHLELFFGCTESPLNDVTELGVSKIE